MTSEVRKSKRLQTDKLADNLKNQSYGQNNWWKTLKKFIKPSQNTSIPPLQHNDEVFSDDQDKADILNHFFTAQTVLDDRGATLPTAAARGNFSLDSISLSPLEVESVLKSLKLGKASGPHQINNRILKELAHSLSFPLCDLFNYSLSCGKVPELWKQANVTRIFKKGDQSEVSNYRPISLLSTIGKAMEKLLVKPSTGSGTTVFYINCILLVSLVNFWIGLLTTSLRGNNMSFSRAFPQIGQLSRQACLKVPY